MSSHDDATGEPALYNLRLQERALRDVTEVYVRMAELVSLSAADAWQEGLRQAIAGLSTNPRRCPLVPEKFKREVRHLLYKRPGSKTTYRILFTISGEQTPSSDPPTVTILHVRHASARPITRTQAREIESQ